MRWIQLLSDWPWPGIGLLDLRATGASRPIRCAGVARAPRHSHDRGRVATISLRASRSRAKPSMCMRLCLGPRLCALRRLRNAEIAAHGPLATHRAYRSDAKLGPRSTVTRLHHCSAHAQTARSRRSPLASQRAQTRATRAHDVRLANPPAPVGPCRIATTRAVHALAEVALAVDVRSVRGPLRIRPATPSRRCIGTAAL